MKASANWLGLTREIEFTADDFEVLDLALSLLPDLRVCAYAIKRARSAGIKYPIGRADDLAPLFGKDSRFEGAGYRVDWLSAKRYLLPEFFPIEHEGELLSRLYLALTRARHAATLAASLEALDAGGGRDASQQ